MKLRSTVALFGLVLGLGPLVIAATGTVGGTVAVASPNREFAGVVARAVIFLECHGKEIKVSADENGDFLGSLPPGRYQLVRVLDASARELRISSRQSRILAVRKNRHTRFDVMVEPPASKAPAARRSPSGPGPEGASWSSDASRRSSMTTIGLGEC